MPPVQLLLRQSLFCAHFLESAHLLTQEPPQSTSVSVPSSTLSVQDAAAQTPPLQVPGSQSFWIEHIFPGTQAAQRGPPQSASVSAPSLTPSVQLAGTHLLATQARGAVQSAVTLQATHLPASLHTLPSLSEHAVPAATLVFTQAPPVQAGTEHTVPVAGHSDVIRHETHLPLPSQTLPPPSSQAVAEGAFRRRAAAAGTALDEALGGLGRTVGRLTARHRAAGTGRSGAGAARARRGPAAGAGARGGRRPAAGAARLPVVVEAAEDGGAGAGARRRRQEHQALEEGAVHQNFPIAPT